MTFRKLLDKKSVSEDLLSVHVSAFISGNPHFEAVLILCSDAILFVDRDDDTLLSMFTLKQLDMREDPQHSHALLLSHNTAGVDTVSEVSSVLTQSTHNVSRDITGTTRYSISEDDALLLTLFMDPVYLKPLLTTFRRFKSGF